MALPNTQIRHSRTFRVPAVPDAVKSASNDGITKVDNMSEEQEFPNTDYILENWLTTPQAAKDMGISEGHVRRLCIENVLRSKKILGRWMIDPNSADNYDKYKHRK